MGKIACYLKYAFFMVSKNFVLTILIILQLALVAFTIDTMLRYSSTQNIEIKAARQLEKKEGVYYIGNDISNIDEELKYVDMIMKIYNTTVHIKNKAVVSSVFTENIFTLIDLPLYQGRWFKNSAEKDDLEIVVTQNLKCKIGDSISVMINSQQEISATVVGILPNNFMYFRMSGGSSIGANMTTKFLFSAGTEDDYMVFFSYEQSNEKNITGLDFMGGVYLNFENDISAEDCEHNLSILRRNGSVATINQMLKNSLDEYNKTLLLVVPFIIFIALLIAISSMLILSVSISSSKQFLSIIYLYGAEWKNIRMIIITYGTFIVFSVWIVSLILNKWLLSGFIKNYGSNVLVTIFDLLIVTITYLIMITITAKILLTKKELISNLKEEL